MLDAELFLAVANFMCFVLQSMCMFEVVFKHLKALTRACLQQLPACCGVNVHYDMHCALFCIHLLLEVYRQL